MAADTELAGPRPARLDPKVVAVAAVAGLSSGIALVVAILSDRPLWATSVFFMVPAFVTFVAVSVTIRRDEQALFLGRLRAGLLAGVLALMAYDASRWLVEAVNLSPTNSFQAIRIFGTGLTARPPGDRASLIAGWAFHVTNGLGFSLTYLFLAAGRKWWVGIGYALVLEAFLIGLYPGWLGLTLTKEFVSVSIMGHVAFGSVLGAIASRTE